MEALHSRVSSVYALQAQRQQSRSKRDGGTHHSKIKKLSRHYQIPYSKEYLLQGIYRVAQWFRDSFFSILFADIQQFSTFAPVNVKKKRHIASWVMLAVFVPMLILSSIHVHDNTKLFEDNCSECVQHHCHGHLGELTTTIHSCVLCQFLTLSFVAAAVAMTVSLRRICKTQYAQRQCHVSLDACGIPSFRAPPFSE